ncbi:MAG: hypothetical protein FWD63_00455 [Propionibacteriaceae bacterium]|nr:hypothetical protein [Propionibacteriaceae bacterium]
MTLSRQRLLSLVISILPFVVFFLAFWVLLLPIELRGASDDTAHISEIIQMGRIQWVITRAVTWQPRIASDIVFSVLGFHLSLWRVLNAAVMSIMLWIVTRIALFGDGSESATSAGSVQVSRTATVRVLTLAVLACLIVFLIHPNVITSGSVWVTGSTGYLWPTAAMLIGLAPFALTLYGKQLPYHKVLVPVCIFFSLAGCFTEQTAAVQVGVVLLTLGYLVVTRQRVLRSLIVHGVFVFVASAAFFYLDFTSPRVTGGTELQFFPAFANFSLIDKLLLGVNVYANHLLHISNLLFTLLLAIVAWLAFRQARRGWKGKSAARLVTPLAFLPALWALVNTLPLPWGYTKSASAVMGNTPGALGIGVHNWLDFLNTTPPMASGPLPSAVVLAVVAWLTVLSPFYLLWLAFSDKRDRFLAVMLYLASFLSGILIGFSPTVWASESRPNYLSNFLLLVILMMLIRASMRPSDAQYSVETSKPHLLQEVPFVRPRLVLVFLAILLAFAVYAWVLYHTRFAANDYWWY